LLQNFKQELAAGFCGHGNEPSGTMKCGDLLD